MIPDTDRSVEHSTQDVQSPVTPPTEDASSPLTGLERSAAGQDLSQLAVRAGEILERWKAAGERHERAVNQLESQLTDFEVTNARLQRDASQKMQDLERIVEHEWTALRQVHEEPIRQLREQANSLTEVCIATAHSAQRGFDQAEARLAAIELDLQQRITELRREVQMVAGELRANPGVARISANPPAWPLDGVTRLHHQLRQGSEPDSEVPLLEAPVAHAPSAPVIDTPVRASAPAPAPAPAERPPATVSPADAPDHLSVRMRMLERALDERDAVAREAADRARRLTTVSRIAVIGMGVVVALAAGFGFWMQSQVSSRVEDAQRRSQEATEAAAGQTTATREQASKEIAAAHALANRAQMVSAVLAAPDLVRFNLVATDPNSAGSAQALWSRARGLVLSGSRLSPVPAGKTYQVWLLARGAFVSAGTFAPDQAGEATLAVEPPATTLPIISVVVSLEPSGGSARPDGPPVLIRTRVQP